MIVHTMSHAEMVADARKDLKALRNKLDKPLQQLRREHARNPEEPILYLYPWSSPNGNNWLVMIRYAKTSVSTYTMAWFQDEDGRVAGLWTAHKGLSYFIDPQVIERYGEQFDPHGSPVERLQSFFFENYFYAMQVEEQRDEQHWNVSIGMNHGLGLGEWDTTSDIVYFRTFVDHGQLFPEQQQMKELDADRLFQMLTPRQRVELANRARSIAAGERRRQGSAA